MKIAFSDSAFEDLNSIKTYYICEGVPDVGESIVSVILDRVGLLEKSPDMGRMVPEFQQEKIREVIQSNYRIVHVRDEGVVTIVRVWRSERVLTLG